MGICFLTVSARFGQLPVENSAQMAQNYILSNYGLALARIYEIDRVESKVVMCVCGFFAFLDKSVIFKKQIRPKLRKMAFFLNMSLYGLVVFKGTL